jgi:WD40 repeat protein
MKKILFSLLTFNFLLSTAIAQKPELVIPSSHDISCYDLSKNGKYLLTACTNITLWEIETGREIATIDLPSVYAISVYIIDPLSGEKILKDPRAVIISDIKFNSDTTFLAYADNGYLYEWNIISKKIIQSVNLNGQIKNGSFSSGCFSENYLFLRLWNSNSAFICKYDILQKKGIITSNNNIGFYYEISKDNKFTISTSENQKYLQKFNENLELVNQSDTCKSPIFKFGISADGKYIITLHFDCKMKLWDANTMKVISEEQLPFFEGNEKYNLLPYDICFSGNNILIDYSKRIFYKLQKYNIVQNKINKLEDINLKSISNSIYNFSSKNEKTIFFIHNSGFTIYNPITSKITKEFILNSNAIEGIALNNQAGILSTIETPSDASYCYSWNLKSFGKSKQFNEPFFAPRWLNNKDDLNKKILSYKSSDSTNIVNVIDYKTGQIDYTCMVPGQWDDAWILIKGGNFVNATKSESDSCKQRFWDLNKKQIVIDTITDCNTFFVPEKNYYFNIDSNFIYKKEFHTNKILKKIKNIYGAAKIRYSYNIEFLIAQKMDSVFIIDENFSFIFSIPVDEKLFTNLDLNATKNKAFLFGVTRKGVDIYDNNSKSFTKIPDSSAIRYLTFSDDQKYIITIDAYFRIKFWDSETYKEICTLISLDSVNFVVTTPSGLFDASPGAMEKMYWVKGLEVIEFNQLKNRYWEPGLWEKAMKGEQLRDVRGMNEIKLQPEVNLADVKNNKLPVTLTKRDGGYGKVVIMINGKEVEADARGAVFDTSKTTQTILYDIKNSPLLIPGKENTITVKAWSADGFVEGRGVNIVYLPEGDTTKILPSFYAVILGVSEYSGSTIKLRYAKPDALAMANSMKLGAENLFGKDRTFIYTLTSPGETKPTKENIKKVFEEIKSKAKPNDILMLYMSGHGITWGGESGDFYYLTSEAYAANTEAYNDPAIREKNTISTMEFTKWIKEIPALKQLMIIDACGSGKAVDNLIAMRNIDASQVKAIDRMKDRTGMYIISGCAADAVSYEASRYGQGLLTYTILQAMKGAALREDKFVDVSTLLNYSRDEVPKLASGVGGIQQPQLLIPKGGSFDIGIMNSGDKNKVVLSNPKPLFVRCNFIDTDQLEDVLGMSKSVDEALNSLAVKGQESSIIFVDTREYPDGCRISGTYSQNSGKITVKFKIKCGDKVNEFNAEGKNVEEIVNLITKNAMK